MKYIMSFIFGGLLATSPLAAQDAVKVGQVPVRTLFKTNEPSVEKQVKEVSVRENIVSQNAINDLQGASWSRDIYRVVSDSLDVNSALFSPRISNKAQVNLLSLLLNLVLENKVKAYRFDINANSGDDLEESDIKEMLDNNKIPYATSGRSYSVNPYDLPTNEVLSYYVKEQWYFDTKTGKGGAKVVAICPVLSHREDANLTAAPSVKSPLFWLSFDEVSPYLTRANASTGLSDLGKVYNISYFDYFKNRHYSGCVYRIGNKDLYNIYKNPADLAIEQKNIEKQLTDIENRFSKFK